MSAILLAASLAAGQCECGPDCECSLMGPCRCVSARSEPAALPSIDRAVEIADELRRPVIVWVGWRDPAGEAALPEAIHAYASAICERRGSGVCIGVISEGGGRSWQWAPGAAGGVGALRAALGSGGGGSAWAGSCASLSGYSAIAPSAGGSAGGCAGGSCGVGGGRGGRRR